MRGCFGDGLEGDGMKRALGLAASALLGLAITSSVCSAQVKDVFRDPKMDFGSRDRLIARVFL